MHSAIQFEIGTGATLTTIQTDKFKSGFLSVNFICPLNALENTKNALLGFVLRQGSASYPSLSAVNSRLDELYGARVEPLIRKRGEAHCIGLYADFIEDRYTMGDIAVQDGVCQLLCDLLLAPNVHADAFHAATVESEKQNLRDLIASRVNDKRSYSVTRCFEEMCRGEAFGCDEYGSADDIPAISASDLFRHYRYVLQTSRIEAFYIGSADGKSLADSLSRRFASINRADIRPVATAVIRRADSSKEFAEQMRVNQAKLCLGYRTGICASDDDYPALAVASAIFGGGPSSKLFMNVRERLSLCYYAGARVEKHKGVMIVYSGIEQHKKDVALNEIRAQLDAVRRADITPDELDAAKRMMINSLRAVSDSAAQSEDYFLSGILSGALTQPDTFIDKINRVDIAQAAAAAQNITEDIVYFLCGDNQSEHGEDA